MFESINEMAVIGCTFFMLALYVLWYAALHTESKTAHQGRTELLMVGTALFVTTSTCAFMLGFIVPSNVTPMRIACALALVAASGVGVVLLKEGKGVREILVHTGYVALMCLGTIGMLYYWPW